MIGLIVLFKCATGIVLVFEDQINAWADSRQYHYAASESGTVLLAPETLLAKVKEQEPGMELRGVILHANREEPAEVWLGQASTAFVNPFTGAIVGKGSPTEKGVRETGTHAFFRRMEDLHRWLSFNGRDHSTSEAVGSVANVLFLFILCTGIYIWFPRKLTWPLLRPGVLFKGGLKGKARDWNWHKVIGIWAVLPLLLIVTTGITLSYDWASNLFFTATGNPQPRPRGEKKKGKKQQAKRAPEETDQQGKARRETTSGNGGGARDEPRRRRQEPSANWDGLDRAWTIAQAKVPGWKTIHVEAPANENAPFTFEINTRASGQAQRSILRVRRTGEEAGFTDFEGANAGEKLRLLARDVHTGELFGFWTEAIVALASAGGGMLVYTGLSLALRRLGAWRKKRLAALRAYDKTKISTAA